jgi:hypothetical protein
MNSRCYDLQYTSFEQDSLKPTEFDAITPPFLTPRRRHEEPGASLPDSSNTYLHRCVALLIPYISLFRLLRGLRGLGRRRASSRSTQLTARLCLSSMPPSVILVRRFLGSVGFVHDCWFVLSQGSWCGAEQDQYFCAKEGHTAVPVRGDIRLSSWTRLRLTADR